VNRAVGEQAAASTQIATSMNSMRRESDQAARALKEQARAVQELTTVNANVARQIKLITTANKEHSLTASGVLDQLRGVRAITDQNARGVMETRGGTAELLQHAQELAGLTQSGNGKRGKPARPSGGNGAALAARHTQSGASSAARRPKTNGRG
jgi:methyl-accepting chemotaxis protein